MMKKVLLMLLLCFNLSAVLAKENVTLVYAFGVADNQMNYYRALADQANSIQNKYNFLVDVKGGAGSTVAAKYVLATPNTILGTSAAHFIRPNLFPTESHRVEDYRELVPMCNIPIVISSIKFKDWASVPKDKPLTVGVAGIGSATYLFVMELKKRYPNLEAVPFKSVSEAMTNMIGGQIDFNSSFLADTTQWNQVTVLGTTGSSRKNNIPTLLEQGFSKDLGNFDNPQHLLVPANLDATKFTEWRDILSRAAKTTAVTDKYAPDFCKPIDVSDSNVTAWYHKQNAHWSKISSGVKLDSK
jgi:tripartite-type tricarboxylate transporter receptor subunit TctC